MIAHSSFCNESVVISYGIVDANLRIIFQNKYYATFFLSKNFVAVQGGTSQETVWSIAVTTTRTRMAVCRTRIRTSARVWQTECNIGVQLRGRVLNEVPREVNRSDAAHSVCIK